MSLFKTYAELTFKPLVFDLVYRLSWVSLCLKKRHGPLFASGCGTLYFTPEKQVCISHEVLYLTSAHARARSRSRPQAVRNGFNSDLITSRQNKSSLMISGSGRH